MTPGSLLAMILRDLGTSQQWLALKMGRPPQMVSEIINGHKRVTAETATQLDVVLGVPARVWLLLQDEADLSRYAMATKQEEV